MNRFLFNRAEYERIYNCSMMSPDEWYAYGKSNVPMGVFFIISGIVYEAFYIPALIVMLNPEFFKIPSYKMMFAVGVIDVLTLFEICFMDGYDTIVGGVFCTKPTRFYLFGIISTFGWYSGTLIGILLAFNRLLEILAPKYAKILFKEKRTWFWIGLCILYGSYALMFQYPFVFNSRYTAVFYDPHFGDEFRVPFSNPAYFAHNLTVAVTIAALYLIICFSWAIKTKEHTSHISTKQRLVNIQSFMISMEIMGAGLIYIYFQTFYVPDFCFTLGHILWQMSHGDTGIVYLLINKSIRTRAIRMCDVFSCGNRISSYQSNQPYQIGQTIPYLHRNMESIPARPLTRCVNTSNVFTVPRPYTASRHVN